MKIKNYEIKFNSEMLDKLLKDMLNHKPIITTQNYIANKDLRLYLNGRFYDIYIILEYREDTTILATYGKELTKEQQKMFMDIFKKWGGDNANNN